MCSVALLYAAYRGKKCFLSPDMFIFACLIPNIKQ
jgi:hypothetical protein